VKFRLLLPRNPSSSFSVQFIDYDPTREPVANPDKTFGSGLFSPDPFVISTTIFILFICLSLCFCILHDDFLAQNPFHLFPETRNKMSAQDPQQGRPQVQACRYKTGKTLGAGSYSVVKECVHIDTGRYYAAKVINKRLMAGREHMVCLLRRMPLKAFLASY
jgi:hypothetical protein